MERNSKFIIIGLVGATLVCLFLFLNATKSQQVLVRERDELKNENNTLNTKIERLANNLRDSEDRINVLGGELEKVTKEKADLDKKYELANRAREELIEKLKAQKQAMQERQQEVQKPQEISMPQTDDAYWASVLKAKTDLEFQLNNVRTELKNIQIGNEQLNRERSNMELDLNNLKREKEDLKRQLDYNQRLMDSIAQELVRDKNDKKQIEDNYKMIRNENAVLGRQIKSLNNRKVTLEKKIQETQEDKAVLERRLGEMEGMLTQRISQIDNLKDRIDVVRSGSKVMGEAGDKKDAVELPAIVVRPQPLPAVKTYDTGASLMGKVLAINKENNFVIVDLGEESGVKAGDTFRVYRGDKLIANIEVIQSRRNISACDIKKTSGPIGIGDSVR